MKLIQEVNNEKLKVLIVAPSESDFTTMLVESLKKFKVIIDIIREIPASYADYDVYFFINIPHLLINEFADEPDKKFTCILFNQDTTAQMLSTFAYEMQINHFKIINLETQPHHFQKDIDTILWFSFSHTDDIFLHIYHPESDSVRLSHKKKAKKPFSLKDSLPKTPREFIRWGLLIILISHFLFIPPLALGTYFNYQRSKLMIEQRKPTSGGKANFMIGMAASLYEFSAPTFHLFSIARPFDNLFLINTSTSRILDTVTSLEKEGGRVSELLGVTNKTPQEVLEITTKKDMVFRDLRLLHEDLLVLEEKLPKNNARFTAVREKIAYYNETIPLILEMEPYMDTFFGKDEEKKYLLFFANNMELRPGGGFIGSFAILRIKQYAIEELKVYDVYDADGQLKEHIAPPLPISKFLNQPFWFLRDSAFTPDFVTNFGEAETLIQKEINETDFDGGILFTTTAIQNILEATDSLYIPDFQETITKDNFYLKAQLYAEDEFFPGSTKKKRFLSSVMNQMLLSLGDVSIPDLVQMMQKSMNEKQLALYSKNPDLQAYYEKNYWAGRTLKPKCNLPAAVNCILDYVFPIEANLGVNKANFFIERPTKITVNIDENGTISNTVTFMYTNNSYEDIFPGGTYKNYFQLMLPPNSTIGEITLDDVLLTDYDETNFEYKTVGFLMETPPQTTRTVTITYNLPTTIVSGNGLYQLILQKQLGSANDNLTLEFNLPSNLEMVNNNFSPLVKDKKINYNTSISSDKIFLIEFSKK